MSKREKHTSSERAAMGACRSGISVRKSAALHGMKLANPHNRINDKSKQDRRRGKRPTIPEDLEAVIVDWLLCSKGIPETYVELRTAIKEYLVTTNTPNKFKENR